ncbi:hypothetical protein Trydic_g12245 [Trypoxylus dichotomus]
MLLEQEWKDPLLCMGLICTASILLGSLFIPRTYMMAVAAARDRFASALPSLATATSAMDIYRASTQPLYDCVNVATINALNARNANHQEQSEQQQQNQQDFYSCPTAPENDYEIQSEATTNPDKVTLPIIPDYLFSKDLETLLLNRRSLSPIQRKFEDLEKDNGPLSALLASKAFVQLIFTPIVGYLTGIIGYNLPLLLGCCNMLIAAILFAYGRSYGILVLARALHGTSSAAIAVSGMCILADTVPKNSRFQLMPLAFGGIALGVLIGYPLGGAAYQFIGKSAPFLFIAIFTAFNIGLQLWCLKERELKEVIVSSSFVEWLQLFKNHKTLIAAGAICISTCTMAILEPCIPIWLMAHFDPPPTKWQLGAVFIPDSIGYFIGSHLTGLLPVASWRLTLSSMLLIGLSCCALPLSTTISDLSLPHFGLGLGVGAVDATLVPLMASLADLQGSSHYGPIYAFQQATVSMAYCFGPLLAGQAVNHMGFPWLIRIAGFINIVFCPLLLYLEKLKDKSPLHREDSLPSYSTLDDAPTNEDWE